MAAGYVFDDAVFAESFLRRRREPQSVNNQIDAPSLLSMAGRLRNCDVLEIGCGAGDLAQVIVPFAPQSYMGMVNQAI
jgi:cyclopropane fatty-acyl-phospholipid synthase-like methyltransferase